LGSSALSAVLPRNLCTMIAPAMTRAISTPTPSASWARISADGKRMLRAAAQRKVWPTGPSLSLCSFLTNRPASRKTAMNSVAGGRGLLPNDTEIAGLVFDRNLHGLDLWHNHLTVHGLTPFGCTRLL